MFDLTVPPMDASDYPLELDPSARCARCGDAFDCGSMTRPFDCWCARLPALRSAAAGGANPACLCPACYAAELAAGGAAPGGPDAELDHTGQ
ncbi:cysteine-rich CWC family protein [Trinickia diaoshuihuensis]|uniref:cysteine-rich CWC family protein n=1 Tax=Trinickia diaoshuihuensis TaxID=2292265 RepID=UPI003B839FDB